MAGSKPAALPLGDSPITMSSRLELRRGCPMLCQGTLERRFVTASGNKILPVFRYLRCDFLCLPVRFARAVNAGSGTCEPGLTVVAQPAHCVVHCRIQFSHQRFAVIATALL